MIQTVFWWNIPCAGMINVLKAYCNEIDPDCIVVTGQLSHSRKAMGWEDFGTLFNQHRIIPNDEWIETGCKLLDEYSDRLHVFNGITYPKRMTELIQYASKKRIAFCNMSEAYFNLENGWRKIFKEIYLKHFLPYRTRLIAKKSLGIICLSGGSNRDLKQFQTLGFKSRDIYPFGYYTHAENDIKHSPARDGKIHLLCPGLLEPYKGVDILIRALYKISSKGIKNFICHITGKGSMLKKLQLMIDDFGLNDCVKMEGVMDNAEYSRLLSCIDVLVAPGRVEPWGIRINEAIQRGQAVIVSDGLGASVLVKESRGGEVFHSGNHNELANAIVNLVVNPEKLATAKENNLRFRHKISCGVQAKRLHSHIVDITRIHQQLKK